MHQRQQYRVPAFYLAHLDQGARWWQDNSTLVLSVRDRQYRTSHISNLDSSHMFLFLSVEGTWKGLNALAVSTVN